MHGTEGSINKIENTYFLKIVYQKIFWFSKNTQGNKNVLLMQSNSLDNATNLLFN